MIRRLGSVFILATAVACSSSDNGPALAQCSAATPTTLVVGAYTALDPAADSGCVSFPANTSGATAEYLVLAQSAGGVPGDSAPYALQSANAAATAQVTRAQLVRSRRALLRGHGPIPARFDRMLHERERVRRSAGRLSAASRAARVAAPAPPVLGTLRSFFVCANYDCSAYQPVTARAVSLGAHSAIYVDTLAPRNGLCSSTPCGRPSTPTPMWSTRWRSAASPTSIRTAWCWSS